ncbi:tRNA-specific adenosine deaminase 2-like [Homarus americanus]|uniref:tRNA-specific adenosine deaminase 2-like n=1 Tax=Homarus americanus TaxID=6706 RepID=UPI001C4527F6|nr:tRNA-specific adenosine deaminase 2-like [Homarus americanus]
MNKCLCLVNAVFKMTNQQKEQWMVEAFSQAREALTAGEVPVGCVFVYNNEIVGRGRNTVNETHNATRHAEMNCVDRVLEWCTVHQLDYKTVFPHVSVYVTVEPCGMCADALGQLSVKDIIFGCSNDRFGGCGSVVDIPKLYKYPMNFQKGVQAEEAIELLKEFYKGENPNAPTGKVKRKVPKN